ncbi:J domain-containing protein [soil metagenome]
MALHSQDHYEVLQVSPRADRETIERVFRLLAKRFHPDHVETGNAERFQQVMEAFRVLFNPEQRARYDATYEEARESEWKVFDQESALSDIIADRKVRAAILALLYTARRNDANNPGIGVMDLERILGCAEEHIRFHLWYLREKGSIQRQDNGMWAITAAGVDEVLGEGGPVRKPVAMLKPSDVASVA